MPEMLKTTSMVMGAGLGNDVACVTDGRFSGGTHGFTVGHVVPEAQNGGPIALIEDGDTIFIDAVNNTIDARVSDEELARRKEQWKPRPPRVSQVSPGAHTLSWPMLTGTTAGHAVQVLQARVRCLPGRCHRLVSML